MVVKEKLIEKLYFKSGCNKTDTYQEIFKVKIKDKEYTVKVYINSDKQYTNYIAVFDINTLEWKNIYSIPKSLMKTPTDFASQYQFQEDIKTLKSRFYEILN